MAPPEKITDSWTAAEIEAVLAVRRALIEENGIPPDQLHEVELIVFTLNSKLRVEDAVNAYLAYREKVIEQFSIHDVWADPSSDGMDAQWHRLAVAGRDEGDRQMMWITSGETPACEETPSIRASIWYFFAVHADMQTLRNGISIVVDTRGKRSNNGNEKKLLVARRSLTSRPQHIYITGTTAMTRVAVNALIAFASLFSKSKVLSRVQFATLEDIEQTCGPRKRWAPEDLGGEERSSIEEWVQTRLESFPRMNLCAYTRERAPA